MSDFLLQTRLLLNSDYFCLGAIYFDGFTIKIAFKEIPPYTIKSLAQNANIGYHIVLLDVSTFFSDQCRCKYIHLNYILTVLISYFRGNVNLTA